MKRLKKWLARMMGGIVCGLTKHKRGRKLKPTDPPHLPTDDSMPWPDGWTRYRCDRYGATWTRKVGGEQK